MIKKAIFCLLALLLLVDGRAFSSPRSFNSLFLKAPLARFDFKANGKTYAAVFETKLISTDPPFDVDHSLKVKIFKTNSAGITVEKIFEDVEERHAFEKTSGIFPLLKSNGDQVVAIYNNLNAGDDFKVFCVNKDETVSVSACLGNWFAVKDLDGDGNLEIITKPMYTAGYSFDRIYSFEIDKGKYEFANDKFPGHFKSTISNLKKEISQGWTAGRSAKRAIARGGLEELIYLYCSMKDKRNALKTLDELKTFMKTAYSEEEKRKTASNDFYYALSIQQNIERSDRWH